MPNVFYRSDDRDLEGLKKNKSGFKGFEAWVQLELADIRKLVTRFNGTWTAPILLKEPLAKWLQEKVNDKKFHRKPLNLGSLGELIKSKVDQSTVHISTDTTSDGGGRGKAHLFKITCPQTLYMVDPKTGSFTQNPASFRVLVNPKLVMNATAVRDATLIALALVGNEVTFLTPIPIAWITQEQ